MCINFSKNYFNGFKKINLKNIKINNFTAKSRYDALIFKEDISQYTQY